MTPPKQAATEITTKPSGRSSQPPHTLSMPNTSAPLHTPPAEQEAATVTQSPGTGPAATEVHSSPVPGALLLDPALTLAAEVVDDIESVRIANTNRLHAMREVFGLDERHADVARLAAMVQALEELERDSVKQLQRTMRAHPLGPWVKARAGVGEKQAARLLAAIGDPYWNTLHDQPRTVSQLWAYCGLHVVPASREASGTHVDGAGGAPDSLTGPQWRDAHVPPAGEGTTSASQVRHETQTTRAGGDSPVGRRRSDTQDPAAGRGQDLVDRSGSGARPSRVDGEGGDPGAKKRATPVMPPPGVAPRRARGQQANWSTTAKTRAYLVAASCVKQLRATCKTDDGVAHVDGCGCSQYRVVYDNRRAHTAVTRPEWTDGHSHNDALRVVAKAILRDLWVEARGIHEQLREGA